MQLQPLLLNYTQIIINLASHTKPLQIHDCNMVDLPSKKVIGYTTCFQKLFGYTMSKSTKTTNVIEIPK